MFVEQLIAVLLILTVFAGHTYSRAVYCTACRGVYIAYWGEHTLGLYIKGYIFTIFCKTFFTKSNMIGPNNVMASLNCPN